MADRTRPDPERDTSFGRGARFQVVDDGAEARREHYNAKSQQALDDCSAVLRSGVRRGSKVVRYHVRMAR